MGRFLYDIFIFLIFLLRKVSSKNPIVALAIFGLGCPYQATNRVNAHLMSYYSHGLESIYAYETIDAKSVKKLHSGEPEPIDSSENRPEDGNHHFCASQIALEREFDFEPRFSIGLPHLALDEPIEILKISAPAVRLLKGAGKQTVRDLLLLMRANDRGVHVGIKEEIERAIRNLFGRDLVSSLDPFERQSKVDWASVLRRAILPLAPRQRALLAKFYGIDALFQFTPHELREADIALSKNHTQQVTQLLLECRFTIARQLFEVLERVFQGYIHTWLLHQHGLESEGEIKEALWSIVQIEGVRFQKTEFESSLKLLCDILEINFIFERYLTHFHKKVWALSPAIGVMAHQVITHAQLLWSKAGPIFTIDALTDLIFREYLHTWNCPSKELIKHVLVVTETNS